MSLSLIMSLTIKIQFLYLVELISFYILTSSMGVVTRSKAKETGVAPEILPLAPARRSKKSVPARTKQESKHFLAHLLGCVKCTGANATTRHHALVRHIYDLCLQTGVPCEREPRQFTTYRCLKCNESVNEQRKHEHQKKCGTASFHRSGPDLAIYWASGEIFYDLTIINEISKTNLGKRSNQLMQEAEKRKVDTYVNSDLIPHEKFTCVSILAGGAMNFIKWACSRVPWRRIRG